MTPQEKLIFRFLLTILIIGLIVGFVRKTWFSESLATSEEADGVARKIANVADQNRTRYLAVLDSDTEKKADSLQSKDLSIGDLVEGDIVDKVNLNTATKSRLMSLPGIGPVIAEKIILYRQDYGVFKSIEDLVNINGIGIKTLDRLRNFITIEDNEHNENR